MEAPPSFEVDQAAEESQREMLQAGTLVISCEMEPVCSLRGCVCFVERSCACSVGLLDSLPQIHAEPALDEVVPWETPWLTSHAKNPRLLNLKCTSMTKKPHRYRSWADVHWLRTRQSAAWQVGGYRDATT